MTRHTVLAAGGVLWRHDPTAPEVALVHRPRYDDWSLPKGKAEPGEHLLVTALREMTEETGSLAQIGPPLRTSRYVVRSRGRPANKIVKYWAMREVSGSFSPSREVDALQWCSVAAARERLTSDSDRAVLESFTRVSRDTRPLLLVRNGSTETLERRRGRRVEQGLSRAGREQAAALVPVLAGVGATDLRSADLPACTELLAPFADVTGLPVRREAGLCRSVFEGREQEIAAQVRSDAAAGDVLVICGQQRVISGLLRGLGTGPDSRPPQQSGLKKGGWWLLHHRDGGVVAFERHEPAA